MEFSVGIDFGTTNSAVAVATGGTVRMARFHFFQSVIETFRSVLFFEQGGRSSRVSKTLAGPNAIEQYLEPHDGGRLIQSLKSFAASRTFDSTQIGGRRYKLEELIGILLRHLRASAEAELGPLGSKAVVGRPVRFVGSEIQKDTDRALARLTRAYAIAGFHEIEFEYEPIGAAYSYAQRLNSPELVLIADFGGGTSDFSLIQLNPGAAHVIVATAGVPIGGDTFDARIVRHLVSPMLGLGTNYQSVDKVLPVPQSLYQKLESWHYLSFLTKSPENIRIIESVLAQAFQPEKIQRFLEIVKDDLGYHLHRAVQETKVDLSSREEAEFIFKDLSLEIHHRVKRSEFDQWISKDLVEIEKCVDGLLAAAKVVPESVDRVFLTGGSSLVPALRNIFSAKFGEDRLASGEEFTSVARGLALVRK